MPSLKIEHPRIERAKGCNGTGLRRREALQLLAANMALIAAGCSKPEEEIVPYVMMPERLVPGIPLNLRRCCICGYGRGVIVTSHEGRPTKIEGNPLHPASLGSTDVFAEAEIFNLYDPSRAQTPIQGTDIHAWEDFLLGVAGAGGGPSPGQGGGACASDRARDVANVSAPDQGVAGAVPRDGVARLRAVRQRRGASSEARLRPAPRYPSPDRRCGRDPEPRLAGSLTPVRGRSRSARAFADKRRVRRAAKECSGSMPPRQRPR